MVKTILKKYGGRYKGTRYLPDAKRAAGLIKPKEKLSAEEIIAAVKEEDEELGAAMEEEVN
jgi:hypothetical protein